MNNNLSSPDIEKISQTIRNWLYISGSAKNWDDCKEYWLKDVGNNLIPLLNKKGFDIIKK